MNDDYVVKLEKMLKRMGSLYTVQDILDKVATDHMQSFAHNNTWVITEVHDYPRRRVLDIVFVVGDIEDSRYLHDKIIEFAENCGATLVRAFGRVGWDKDAKKNGWQVVDRIYHKEL